MASTVDIDRQPKIKLNASALLNVREAARGRRVAVWVGKLDCRSAGPIHSDDRVLVYSGRVEPERICGFHSCVREMGARWSTYVTPEPR